MTACCSKRLQRSRENVQASPPPHRQTMCISKICKGIDWQRKVSCCVLSRNTFCTITAKTSAPAHHHTSRPAGTHTLHTRPAHLWRVPSVHQTRPTHPPEMVYSGAGRGPLPPQGPAAPPTTGAYHVCAKYDPLIPLQLYGVQWGSEGPTAFPAQLWCVSRVHHTRDRPTHLILQTNPHTSPTHLIWCTAGQGRGRCPPRARCPPSRYHCPSL